MGRNPTILDKQPGGWTLIVLLIVVAIIALLMALYLPSVFQVYRPPSSADEEGTRKPTLEHVRDQLEGVDERNKEIDNSINQQAGQDQEQTEEDQEDQEDDYDQ